MEVVLLQQALLWSAFNYLYFQLSIVPVQKLLTMLAPSVFQLMDRTGAVPAILFDTYLKVSALVHPFGWLHRTATSLIHNH